MKIKNYLLGVLVIGVISFSSMANASGKGYFGFSFGTSDDEELNETESGFKLVLGSQFSEGLAGEIAYVDLGTIDYGFAEVSQYGVAFNLIPSAKINDNFSVFGKFGLYSWTFEIDSGGFIGEDTGTDIAYGFGLELRFSEKASFLAEYEAFEVSDGDVSLVSAGLKFSF